MHKLRFFFFNDTATTEIYTLSLHDALPISPRLRITTSPIRTIPSASASGRSPLLVSSAIAVVMTRRSEEHTSELQSQSNIVCRLLLEKKKNNKLLVQPQTDSPAPVASSSVH